MTALEFLFIISSGYVCGFAAVSGVLVGKLRPIFFRPSLTHRVLAWWALAVTNLVCCVAAVGFIMGLVLFNDGMGDESLSRTIIFAAGVLAGLVLSLGATYVIEKNIKALDNNAS